MVDIQTLKTTKIIMRNALTITLNALMVLAILDLMILFAGLGQIAFEGRTGYWSPFWRTQAEFVIGLLK